jgi:hypothetical protein
MAEQKSAQELPQPLRAAASALGRVPGAGLVGRAAGGVLERVGAVSPRGRRIAVYTGAGVLGVAGVVEWPVAITGAAVAWLTQPRPQEQGADRPADPRAGIAGGAEQAVPAPGEQAVPAPGEQAGPDLGEQAVPAPGEEAVPESRGKPTPRVMAATGADPAPPATPSDRLPAHHAAGRGPADRADD